MRESFIEVLPPFPQHIFPPKPKAPVKRVKVKRPGPIAHALYKAATHMQRHGYTHDFETLRGVNGPACFIGTFEHALRNTRCQDWAERYFQDLIFGTPNYDYPENPFSEIKLEMDGWNKKDAVAALRIAADYAAAAGV